jgi:GntR family transcriptional regulator/MocR family aminotransferase
VELLVTLDPHAAQPLHVQLERALRDDVRAARLPAGTRLPASRTLARQLGVSRGVVVEAYAQLTAEGYLVAQRGVGTRVASGPRGLAPAAADDAEGPGAPPAHAAPDPGAPPAHAPPRAGAPPRYSFHMGEPDLSSFPRDAWVAATRRALQRMPDRELGYSGVRGSPALREALAEHLGRTRGAVARPDRTLIVSGLAQGLMLLGQALVARGTTRVAVEDPGYHGHGLPLRAAGLEVVPVAVDGDGIDVTRAIAAGVGAIVVTPAHQAPTGVVLAPDRRTALLEWAQRTGGLIVEDDYDAEYRYDREPVGALQGRAPDHVLYAG